MGNTEGVPPADGDVRAEAYAATRIRVRDLLTGLDDDGAATIVPACPDWTVHDTVAHLAGVCRDLAEGRRPDGDVQDWVDRQVEERRGVGVPALLDEWDEFGPAFEDRIRAHPVGLGGLLYDVVAHEHDLAGALGRTAERSGSGIDLSIEIMLGLVAADLAAHGLPAVEISNGATTWRIGEGEPEFAVELPPFELMRWLGSRRTLAEMEAVPHRGDLERFLPGLAHLPLPTTSLKET